jgi:hypothetical protein
MEIGIREDAMESGQRLASLEEDEEKFYDRTLLELQLAALLRLGCPAMGYVEFKADDMVDRIVYIITRQGLAIAMYLIGLLQGSVLSVAMSNPITAIKFVAW